MLDAGWTRERKRERERGKKEEPRVEAKIKIERATFKERKLRVTGSLVLPEIV